ncbi:MAG: Holliday junction branch migration protein RuvA [Desulfomonile sp.]|nr:Holliday junction branch migration protein RuvA [Desulfomonile sp.]
MIAALKGKVICKDDNRVIVDVNGVGYDVSVSGPTMASIYDDAEVFFHIYTSLRENSLELYGFIGQDEKTLFELLLGVSGIGPRLALAILSGMSPARFQQAILCGDPTKLTVIPGIGRKSAERMILELKEKIKKVKLGSAPAQERIAGTALEDDLVSSLVNLGYKEQQARTAAQNVLGRNGNTSLGEAVRSALKELAKHA